MRRIYTFLFVIIFTVISFSSITHAATGTIDATDHLSRICTNDACTTYNRINWKATYCVLNPADPNCTNVDPLKLFHPVSVTDSLLTGDLWSENWSWIRLNPVSGAPQAGHYTDDSGLNCTASHVEMSPAASGILSGCAWGQNIGWINFKPTHGGVTIGTTTGEFSGWAWGESVGWIKFDCTSPEACVKTDWRPATTGTTQCSDIIDNDGDNLIDMADPDCSSPTDNSESGTVIITGGGSCLNGATNYPICTLQNICSNGAQDYPTCTPPVCSNGATNYPTCTIDYCALDQNDPLCTQTFCQLHPTDPSCTGQTFCQLHPTDPSCTQTFCQLHPTDPSCTGPIFCQLHPNDVSCTGPIFCESHPTDPTCTQDFCQLHPTDPSCTQTFCQLHPTDPSCTGQTFCQLHPTDPACTSPQSFCQIYPNDPSCKIEPPTGGEGGISDVWSTLNSINTDSIAGPISKIISLIGAGLGVAMTLAGFFSIDPFAIADLASLPLRLWTLLLAALGLRRKAWGVVYDAITKQPLDPVYVTLSDMTGAEVATSITDLDGRYGFLMKPGQYTISAGKTNYLFPSQKLKGKNFDELYQDLYFGEPITVSNSNEIIAKNIPMDPVGFDWNEFAKRDRKLMSFYTENAKTLSNISRVFFYVGFAVSLVAVIGHPQLFNILIFSLYVLIFILRRFGFKPKPYGGIVEKRTGYVLPFSVLRIYSPTTQVEIVHKIADAAGRYYCLLANGTYYATIEVKNPDGTYTKSLTTPPFSVTKGYIDRMFEI